MAEPQNPLELTFTRLIDAQKQMEFYTGWGKATDQLDALVATP